MQKDFRRFLKCPMVGYVGVAVIAAGVRIFYNRLVGFPEPFGDAGDYLAIANAITSGNNYPLALGEWNVFMRPPLFPLLLAFVQRFFGENIQIISLIQALLGGLAAGAAAWSAATLFSRYTVVASFVTGLGIALHPILISFSSSIRSEALFVALAVCGIAVVVSALRQQGPRAGLLGIASGCLLAMATLTRSNGLLIILSVVVSILLANWQSRRVVAACMIGVILMIFPWSFYIHRLWGEWILVDNALGYMTWYGNNHRHFSIYEGHVNTPSGIDRVGFEKIQIRDTREALEELRKNYGYDLLGPRSRSALWSKLAWQRAIQSPKQQVKLLFYKLLDAWRPWVNPSVFSAWKVVVSGFSSLLLWLLAVLGFSALWKRSEMRWYSYFIGLLVVLQTVALVIVLPQIRYRVAAVDPFFLILAGGGSGALLVKLGSLWRAERLYP